MNYLRYRTVIDKVDMDDCILSIDQISYAEPWLLNGYPDPKSSKIYMMGSTKAIHVHLSLEDVIQRCGLIAVDTWLLDGNIHPEITKKAINISNITQIRPYTLKHRIDHFVIYMPGASTFPVMFHISEKQGKRLQETMLEV